MTPLLSVPPNAKVFVTVTVAGVVLVTVVCCSGIVMFPAVPVSGPPQLNWTAGLAEQSGD